MKGKKMKNLEKIIKNKDLHTAGFPLALRLTGMTENGRSMVEMLGVLAIIGVLSVGGIAGYTNAMNKHRANELLNEASKRAAIVAMQFASGRTEGSLAEFTNNTVAGAEFTTTVTIPTTNTNQFTITFTSGKTPSEAICNQMKTAVGTNTIIRNIAADCSTITFNKDLSITTWPTDYKTEADCKAPFVWCKSSEKCQNAEDYCAITDEPEEYDWGW